MAVMEIAAVLDRLGPISEDDDRTQKIELRGVQMQGWLPKKGEVVHVLFFDEGEEWAALGEFMERGCKKA